MKNALQNLAENITQRDGCDDHQPDQILGKQSSKVKNQHFSKTST
jgi:uncharacterized protein YheU (UPF0270 family)